MNFYKKREYKEYINFWKHIFMKIIIQLLIIVWTMLSLTVSATFTSKWNFASKNIINNIKPVILNQWSSKHIDISLLCTEDSQIDGDQDKQEDKRFCGNWKTKNTQILSLKTNANIDRNIKSSQIIQSNIISHNFTDLVGIIKLTI